jgi:N utilization substance protein A
VIPLEKFEVSDRVFAVISEAGFQTVGDLLLQMRLDPDTILKLNGMGPKAMRELQDALDKSFPPEPEEVAAPVVEGEAVAPEAVMEVIPAAVEVVEGEVAPIETVTLEAPAAELAEAPVVAEEVPVIAVSAEEAPVEAALAEGVPAEGAPAEVAAPEGAEPQAAPEEEVSALDELFALRPEVLELTALDEEEDEEEGGDKKKKKKKKKYVEVEYDPERDVLVTRKKRKRGDSTGWEW